MPSTFATFGCCLAQDTDQMNLWQIRTSGLIRVSIHGNNTDECIPRKMVKSSLSKSLWSDAI
jgi:hypothetical protein